MTKKESKSKEHESTPKENAPLVRREIFNMETLNILLSSIILVILLVGPGASTLAASDAGPSDTSSSPVVADEAACRTFCEFNPSYENAIYAGLSSEGHCLCEIALDSIPVYAENKTMSANVIVDQGIILKDITLEEGLPAETLLSSY